MITFAEPPPKPKRFIVFAGHDGLNAGGAKDRYRSYDGFKNAKAAVRYLMHVRRMNWAHVFDSAQNEIVWDETHYGHGSRLTETDDVGGSESDAGESG